MLLFEDIDVSIFDRIHRALFLFLVLFVLSADAGILSWIERKVETGTSKSAHMVEKGAAIALTRQELATLAIDIGSGATVVEFGGGKLIMNTLHKGDVLSGTLDDLSSFLTLTKKTTQTPIFVLSTESGVTFGARLDDLLKVGEVYIVESGLKPMRVTKALIRDEPKYFKEISSGVLAPIEILVPSDINQLLGMPLRYEDISVVSMFSIDDVDALARLTDSAGGRLVDSKTLIDGVKDKSIAEFAGKNVVVVGHIENGAFIARNAQGEISHVLEIGELEKAAARSSVNVFSVGCSSYCAGSKMGYTTSITDLQVSEIIQEVVKSTTVKDMLTAFGKVEPFVISSESLSALVQTHRLELFSLSHYGGLLDRQVQVLRIKQAFARPLPSLSDLPMPVFLWLLGWFAVLFMADLHRDALYQTFPKVPYLRSVRVMSRDFLVKILAELLFFLITPLISLIVIFSIFNGHWHSREKIINSVWFAIGHPLKVIRWCFYLIPYGVLIFGWLELGFDMLVDTLTGRLWLDIVILFFYSLAGIWFLRKYHFYFSKVVRVIALKLRSFIVR